MRGCKRHSGTMAYVSVGMRVPGRREYAGHLRRWHCGTRGWHILEPMIPMIPRRSGAEQRRWAVLSGSLQGDMGIWGSGMVMFWG